MLELIDNLFGRDFLGIEHQLDAHLLEHQLVLAGQIALVVNSGNHFPGTELLGYQRRKYIEVPVCVGIDRDEEVRLADFGLSQHRNGRWVTPDHHDVGIVRQPAEPLLVIVDDCNVIGFATQQFCEMGTYLSRTGNDYFHFVFRSSIASSLRWSRLILFLLPPGIRRSLR